jgi:hypothetical protein
MTEKQEKVDALRFRKYLLSKGWTLKDGFWSAPSSWAENNKGRYTPFSESKLAKDLDDEA